MSGQNDSLPDLCTLLLDKFKAGVLAHEEVLTMLDLLPDKFKWKEQMKAILLSLSIGITSGHELQINSLDHTNMQCFKTWSTLKNRASAIRKRIDEEAASERKYTIMRDLISLKKISHTFCLMLVTTAQTCKKKNILLVQAKS